MNKHCMSVASLRVGTPLGFDRCWRAWVGTRDRERGGRTGMHGWARWREGVGGRRAWERARGRGWGGGGARARDGGKVQANFRLFFVYLIQPIP